MAERQRRRGPPTGPKVPLVPGGGLRDEGPAGFPMTNHAPLSLPQHGRHGKPAAAPALSVGSHRSSFSDEIPSPTFSSAGNPDSSPATANIKPIASYFTPRFIRELAAPEGKSIALIGCGAPFDYLQAMIVYPELQRLGKTVVLVSNGHTDPTLYSENSPRVWAAAPEPAHHQQMPGLEPQQQQQQQQQQLGAVVVEVSAQSRHPHAQDEIELCAFLDYQRPEHAPHTLLSCCSKNWSVRSLAAFLSWVCLDKKCTAVVAVDGGASTLMRGDEPCIGNSPESVVTLGALVSLGDGSGHRRVHMKGIDTVLNDDEVLAFASESGKVSEHRLADPRQGKRGSRKMRYGTFEFATHESAQRFVQRSGTRLGRYVVACEWDRGETPARQVIVSNFGANVATGISDSSSMRAIAELTKAGGYKGSFGLEPGNACSTMFLQLLRRLDDVLPSACTRSDAAGHTGNVSLRHMAAREASDSPILGRHADALRVLTASIEGNYGPAFGTFVWPLMAQLWVFDPDVMGSRSLLLHWLREVPPGHLEQTLGAHRKQLRSAGALQQSEAGRDSLTRETGAGFEPDAEYDIPSLQNLFRCMPLGRPL
ncbi:hypothetical protein DIPPA_09982 [Diplonema papillatum]|nr:hypothetical protein DIPPA_09982 [Diplonema papillatum]|eukprot:gene12241-18908_t